MSPKTLLSIHYKNQTFFQDARFISVCFLNVLRRISNIAEIHQNIEDLVFILYLIISYISCLFFICRFPRYLNEVLCQAGSGCFQGEGICQQKYFTMKILKKTGNCVPLTQNGQKVYIEEWIPTWQNIRICCECQLRSNSWMTNLI